MIHILLAATLAIYLLTLPFTGGTGARGEMSGVAFFGCLLGLFAGRLVLECGDDHA